MAVKANAAQKNPEFLNSGDSDASPDGKPSQFLLIKGLEPTVTEELLAKGVAKLYKPTHSNQHRQGPSKKGPKIASTTGDANLGAKEGSILRVLLVRDRQTNESWRYGFAEFSSVEVSFSQCLDTILPVAGGSSSFHTIQLVREVYHFFKASLCFIYSHRRICAGLQLCRWL